MSIIIVRQPKKLKAPKTLKPRKARVKKVKALQVHEAPKVAPQVPHALAPVIPVTPLPPVKSVTAVIIQGTTTIEIPAVAQVIDFRYGFLTGAAGSGKTFRIRQILETDSSWGLVTATTGPAARVLGPKVPTIHSALGFFDQRSLERAYADGTLRKNIRVLLTRYARIIIDEASMLSAEMFDLILLACEAEGMGLILVGDFLQLPPVTKDNKPPSWLFNSKNWTRFSKNTVRLQTQYRHTNADFVKGLNHLRAGEGGLALPYLAKAGVTFPPVPTVGNPDTFDGVILTATKSARDVINNKRYEEIEADEVTYNTERWGKQVKEWKDINDTISLKVGCRVMVLRNLYEKVNGKMTLTQANGETGEVLSMDAGNVQVRRDDGSIIWVTIQKTDNADRRTILMHDESRLTETMTTPTGGVDYMPLALAFAINVHKAQGLTITAKTQLPIWQHPFWKTPAMLYVAASRVKNPEDLNIVGADMMWGDKPLLEEQCHMDAKCKQWV